MGMTVQAYSVKEIERLIAERDRLRAGWLRAIEAIDHQEVKTAEACERYPQEERDIDRQALNDLPKEK